MRTCSGLPVIPPYLITKVRRISKAVTNMHREGSPPDVFEISKITSLPYDEVEELLPLVYQQFSIDEYEILSDYESADTIYEQVERNLLIQKELQKKLSELQLYVICHIYELFDYNKLSTTQMAAQRHISPTKIRQAKSEAIEILQNSRLLQMLNTEII